MTDYEEVQNAARRTREWLALEDAEKRIKAAVEQAKSKLECILKELEIRLSHEAALIGADPSVASTENFIIDEKAFLDDKASDVAGAMFKVVDRRVG